MTNWREERRPMSRIERLPIDDLATRADAEGGRPSMFASAVSGTPATSLDRSIRRTRR
jgi:hypothetical protein